MNAKMMRKINKFMSLNNILKENNQVSYIHKMQKIKLNTKIIHPHIWFNIKQATHWLYKLLWITDCVQYYNVFHNK